MTDDRDEQVRQRAYKIWQDEGEPAGRDREHWSQAEAEFGDEDSAVQPGDVAGESEADVEQARDEAAAPPTSPAAKPVAGKSAKNT